MPDNLESKNDEAFGLRCDFVQPSLFHAPYDKAPVPTQIIPGPFTCLMPAQSKTRELKIAGARESETHARQR